MNRAIQTKKAAVKVTGDELGEYSDLKDLRKKAIQYYKDNLQGTSVENKTLGKIDIDENGLVNFTGSGKRELKNSSAKINKLLLVKYLPELIRDTTDITSKASSKEKHNGDYFYYLHTAADINGKNIPVEITVIKRNNGEIQYYNHTLPTEEKTKDTVVSTEPESSNEALGTLSIPVSSILEDVSVSSGTESSNEANVSPTVNTSSAENIPQSSRDSKEFSNEDKIEDSARQALKAAGLEGKIAPEGYIPVLSYYATIERHPNQFVLVERKDNQKISGTVKKNLSTLAEECNGEKFRPVNCGFIFKTESDGLTFFRALQIYLNNEGVNENESSELGESGRTSGGHQVRESAVREPADETARQEGNDKISEGVSGQQQQDTRKSDENLAGTNAENARPDGISSERVEGGRTGEGDGVRGSESVVQPAAGTERGNSRVSESSPNVEFSGHNFHITDDSEIGEGGLKTKFKQNVDAIKLLKQLEREGRKATPSEQKILAKFNGWGTLADVFTNNKNWQKENQQLKELLTDEEYQAANAAITNAFYTSPKIAQTIWRGLKKLGFKGGRILDPSMGSGIFFGTMPSETAAKSELTGVEKDSLTGRIAQQLYQKAAIDIMGFEERRIPNNFFDVVITNVPFNSNVKIYSDPDYKKQGYDLHNFFFAKSMDKVRPGGFVAFITSQETMQSTDAQVQRLRAEIDGKADLIAAYKLPNTAFDKNANTKVTSDILILQKRLDPKKPSEYAQNWNEIETISVIDDSRGYKLSLGLPVNEYFKSHLENMIGTPVADWRGNLALDGDGRNVEKELSDLMSKLPENIFVPIQSKPHDTLKNTFAAMADQSQREKSFTVKDGKVMQKRDGKLFEVEKNQPVIKDFLTLQQSLDNIHKAELSPKTTDQKLSELRKRLNQNYDRFVKNHGYLNAKKNLNILGEDPNYGKVAAIENYKEDKKTKKVSASKADIFYKRTVSPIQEVTSADNSVDALSLSLSKFGRIDIDYMQKLTGKSEDEIAKELGDLIYKNPETNLQELAEEYLSGNVREKLSYAREVAKNNPEFKRNVEALEKIQPVDLTEKEISPHLGAPWIDGKYYEDFAKHMIDNFNGTIEYDNIIGTWIIESDKNRNSKNLYTWGVADTKWDFINLLEAAMNKHTPIVTKDKETDVVKTAEVKEKIERIKEEFEKWIWTDDTRKKDLLQTYNKIFNSEVLREYDGSHLTFPGLAAEVKNKLYPHQKDVVWRMLQGKNTLIAHAVGAGKTWAMQTAAMEMKRVGLIKKPLFVVPPNILKQFEREFLTAYPDANLLVLTAADLKEAKVDVGFEEKIDTKEYKDGKESKSAVKKSAKKETEAQKAGRLAARRKALSRIAVNDWDGIIISHDMFMRLPMSPQTYNEFYREQIRLLEHSKRMQWGVPEGAGEVQYDKKHKKAIEHAIANLEQKLKRDIKEKEKEIVIPFEELGIDQIFVDEADMFKNLGFITRYSGRGNKVVGVSTTNAQRSLDMFVKTKWLTKQRNGGGVCFATGTPISNSLNEVYTMQRYLDAATLEEKKCQHFDGWAGTFCKEARDMEVSPDGNGFREVTRLNLTNLQSLIKMFKKFTDIKMAEDLPHLKRPKLKNDDYTRVSIEATEAFKEFKKELLVRAEAVHNGEVDPTEDNFLKIVSDFRKASLDMRLIDPSISEAEAGGKINAICDSVFAKFKETEDVKGTQLIFSDLSTLQQKN